MEENNKKQICHKCCHKYILLRVIVKVYNNSVHRLNMVCSMAWIQYTFIRISFRHIKSFIRFRLAFVFGLQTYYLIDFSKIYPLKGLEPKNKD